VLKCDVRIGDGAPSAGGPEKACLITSGACLFALSLPTWMNLNFG